MLCLRGADPHATDKEGYTPLDDARYRGAANPNPNPNPNPSPSPSPNPNTRTLARYRGADRCCAVESPL